MQRIDHPLIPPSLGTQRLLSSLHFGPRDRGRKVCIQASLHAGELPGMLVAHHLRGLLQAAEDAGRLRAEVVLVPLSNPIGLAQRLNHQPAGRFEFDSAENFNRNYPQLARAILPEVLPQLGPDAATNRNIVRGAMARQLERWQPATELESLRKALFGLSFDADLMLDLHCDAEAVLHFYCEEACWPELAPLAHFLGAEAILLAHNSGGDPIDECLSGVWWQLGDALRGAGATQPLPQGCCSCTIELRGEADVSHQLARQDAQAILDYLGHAGILRCETPPQVPAPRCQPTPLAGSETLHAPVAGLVAFAVAPGQRLQADDLVAEIIDPLGNLVTAVRAGVAGVFYARVCDRYVHAGGELGKIAGASAFRSGPLLGA